MYMYSTCIAVDFPIYMYAVIINDNYSTTFKIGRGRGKSYLPVSVAVRSMKNETVNTKASFTCMYQISGTENEIHICTCN